MKIEELVPECDKKPNGFGAEQLFITGQKGTGKSTLERRIIDCLPDSELVIVVDSKHDWTYRKGRLAFLTRRSVREWCQLPTCDLRFVPAGRYIYRPEYPEISDAGAHKIFLTSLKAAKPMKRSITLVIDEGGDFAASGRAIRPLGKVLREGRSMWVRIIFGCQRPVEVPLLAIQEAGKVIMLRLQNAENRKRLADWIDQIFATNPEGWHDLKFVDVRRHIALELRQVA